MKVGVLFSGGKDSTFAMYWAEQQGWDLRCLISLNSKNKHSFMFHTPNINLAKVQAECLDLPIIFKDTDGEKEIELEDMKAALKEAKEKFGIDTVITGAVASNYQEERVNRVCQELNLRTFSPLWHKDQLQLLNEMLDARFDIRIIAIAAYGLNKSYLGRKIDQDLINDFKKKNNEYGLHVAGEGGEFESFVVDCPLFKKRIEIIDSEPVMENENAGFLNIKEVKLLSK